MIISNVRVRKGLETWYYDFKVWYNIIFYSSVEIIFLHRLYSLDEHVCVVHNSFYTVLMLSNYLLLLICIQVKRSRRRKYLPRCIWFIFFVAFKHLIVWYNINGKKVDTWDSHNRIVYICTCIFHNAYIKVILSVRVLHLLGNLKLPKINIEHWTTNLITIHKQKKIFFLKFTLCLLYV